MKAKYDDSFLTCVSACATITAIMGMPIESVLSNYGQLSEAFDKVVNTKIDCVPTNFLKSYTNLVYDIGRFRTMVEGKKDAHIDSSAWT